MTGLPIADVREMKPLQHLTEEEASKVKLVHLYVWGWKRSALYITTDDEVYLAGRDIMVLDWDLTPSVLKRSRLIPQLSGKSIVKVFVCNGFGAALTADHDLYLWGRDEGRPDEVPAGLSRLALEDHHDGAGCCPQCNCELVSHRRGRVLWSMCPKCRTYCNRVSSLPPLTSWVGRLQTLLSYKTHAAPGQIPKLFCVRCGGLKECEVEEVKNSRIVCCKSCHHATDGQPPKIPPQTNSDPHKVTFPTPLHIMDISAGWRFLLVQTSSELIIWGHLVLDGQKYNDAVLNPDDVAFAKVACGGNHVAVITDKGELYTCGSGYDGELGYQWSAGSDGYMTLKKVELAVTVVDVACGWHSTICLLQDGRHIVYGTSHTKVLNVGVLSLNTSSSIYLVPEGAPKTYLESIESAREQLEKTMDRRSVGMTGVLTNDFIILQGPQPGKPPGTDDKMCKVQEPSNDPSLISVSSGLKDTGCQTESDEVLSAGRSCGCLAHISHSSHLFGHSLLSDFTLKLADGDFPGHRSVLFTFSNYFKQLFTDSGPLDVLDVSNYNPSAYHSLLRYFYGVPRTHMTIPDLFDLYILATSYKEDWIAADVLTKINDSIS